jgi:hypothetical protein
VDTGGKGPLWHQIAVAYCCAAGKQQEYMIKKAVGNEWAWLAECKVLVWIEESTCIHIIRI